MATDGPVSDLLVAAAELVDVTSVSHQESALADLVAARLSLASRLEVTRIGDNVIARTSLGRSHRVVLGGHLDTVPPNGNETARIEGDILWGLGSADMKGGLAVMLDLASTCASPAVDVTYVFYAAEEVAREHNGLLQIDAARPDLLAGDVAILGEPTGAVIEAGCQGVVKASITLSGARAHTARPWMGVNAVHRLAPLLSRVAAFPERQPVIDGCTYHEALQAVSVSGGVAGNVVPDRATVTVNHRYAPDRSLASAVAALEDWITPALDPSIGDTFQVIDDSPAASPGLSHPLLAALLHATGAPPRAKLGWTDVAFFAERGIPAVNFGPGDPEIAHTAGEKVSRADLESVRASLLRFLAGA